MIIGGFDIETTGLFEPAHRIIEVALVTFRFDKATGMFHEIDSYTQRINPERGIDQKARDVHGISDSDLIGKPKWDEVAPDLCERLNVCDVVVGHNLLDFDGPFLIKELERIGHDIPDFEPFDTMVEGRFATAFGKAPNLRELCWACGVDYDVAEAHAAEYDVRVMMQCLFFGLNRGAFKL